MNHTNTSFASESFSYDSNGNRNMSGDTTATGNELSSDGTYNYTYDADGNMITKTSVATGVEMEYTWDYRNRLTKVQQVSGGVTTTLATYTYDTLNRLIEVVEGGATRYTLYDGQTPLLDFNSSGTVTARYLSVSGAIDDLLARQTTAGVAWYITDREGSVNDIINNSGTVIDHVDYGVYGLVFDELIQSNGDRFKFGSMEYDSNDSFYYDRSRWYNPGSGSFVSADKTGFSSGDSNIYRYAIDNASNNKDINGLECIQVYVGAYIPWYIGCVQDPFGFQYLGDFRGPGQAGTSRIHVTIDVCDVMQLFAGLGQRPPRVKSDLTTQISPLGIRTGTSPSTISKWSWDNATDTAILSIYGVSGYDPLLPFASLLAPTIDFDVILTFKKNPDGTVSIDAKGSHDYYPAYDVTVIRENSSRSCIYSYLPPAVNPNIPMLSTGTSFQSPKPFTFRPNEK